MTLAAFVAVEGLFLPTVAPTLLTPRAMLWRPGVWLLDLSGCHSYWQTQAAAAGLAAASMLEEVLRRGLEGPWRAVWAEHPWQALVALAQMRGRGLQGSLDLGQAFGRAFYQQVSWTAWLACAEEFGACAAALPLPRFQATVFHRQLRQLQTTMERLRQPTPWSLRSADALAMRRRFGSMVAMLWDWSQPNPAPRESGVPPGFPWRIWAPAEKPSVRRHLEEPIDDWSLLTTLLQEDLDRLCRLPSWDPQERVTAISWRLTLEDLTVLVVPVRFRHPHSLAREQGHHRTTLLQASYSFEASKKAANRAVDCRGLLGWQLEVDERLVLPPFMADLFGDGMDSDARSLLAIENQLAVPLKRYSLREDWWPETSYGHASAAEFPAYQWLELARTRPFYLETPRRLRTNGCSTGRIFLERVSGKWWLDADSPPDWRDYYAVIDQAQRWLWAFRDQAGSWWVHGRFD